MTAFNIDLNTEQPDRIFVEVDRRFDVAIERTRTASPYASPAHRRRAVGRSLHHV